MAIAMEMQSYQLTEVSGWDYMAQLSYGWNGDMWGPREVTAMDAYGSTSGEYMTWDVDPSDGTDSGWLDASMSFSENGLYWGVDGATVQQQTIESDGIDYIDIRAVVKNESAMFWRDASVFFFKNGVITEQIDLQDFGVTTMGNPGTRETTMRVTPSNSDNDKVVVSGMVRLMAPAETYPAEDDIFSQILIYT